MGNKITEYDNAMYINDYRVPYVVTDSVKVDNENKLVTLTVAFSQYDRIFEQKEPVELYKFKDHLPK